MLSDVLARITLDSESGKVRDIFIHQRHLRFKCRRCASLCCRLGGPRLTRQDAERIRKAGYDAIDFLDPLNNKPEGLAFTCGSLKSGKDGSCIFLKSRPDQKRYECSIYDFRPALCRLYPFDFERKGPNVILLKLIPCCRGLSDAGGVSVDEEFIAEHLLTPLLEALESF
jgi:Fe-S-cluster containining protein